MGLVEGSGICIATSSSGVNSPVTVSPMPSRQRSVERPQTCASSPRQDGFQDFTDKITVRPGEKQAISVRMVKDPRFKMPSVFSEIKLSVTPDRAAVFVDGLYVGHVGEFGGVAKSLLVAPGHRKITISLPGYQTFNTEVDLVPNQKFQIKTDLIKEGSIQPQPE